MPTHGFNPKARWDRRIAGSESTPETLEEPIEVLALFRNTRIFPQQFTWKDRAYPIQRITYAWQERRGQELISYFSVDTGSNIYQISFNNTTFGWRVEKVIQ